MNVTTSPNPQLSADDEAELVANAQAGSEGAMLALLAAYAPAIHGAVRRYRVAMDPDDAEQEARLAFVEFVLAHDTAAHGRLAGVVAYRLTSALSEASRESAPFSIPARTLQRFFGLLRRANGDVDAALALAGPAGMSRETFFNVLDAMRATGSLEGASAGTEDSPRDLAARSLWDNADNFADSEDRILCEIAFAAVDQVEADVCGLAYGFSDYDPQPDAEIAERLGMSRPTVQRRRSSALAKMRDALGA